MQSCKHVRAPSQTSHTNVTSLLIPVINVTLLIYLTLRVVWYVSFKDFSIYNRVNKNATIWGSIIVGGRLICSYFWGKPRFVCPSRASKFYFHWSRTSAVDYWYWFPSLYSLFEIVAIFYEPYCRINQLENKIVITRLGHEAVW